MENKKGRPDSQAELEGADHSFKAVKTDTMPLLINETKKWVDKIMK